MVKQKRIEKRPEVPQERGTPQRRAGRAQPRRSSHRLSKNQDPRAQGQRRVDGKDLQEGWETIKEIDRVLGHLEGRLDKVTAVIRQVAVQGKALELAMPEEDEEGAGCGESSGELEVPLLQSSMEGHRIVDIQEPAPSPSRPEEPREEAHPSPSGVRKDDRREDREEWPSLEEQRRRAEEEYDKLGGLSHGCRQSWDLRMR